MTIVEEFDLLVKEQVLNTSDPRIDQLREKIRRMESANQLMHYQLYGSGENSRPWMRALKRGELNNVPMAARPPV